MPEEHVQKLRTSKDKLFEGNRAVGFGWSTVSNRRETLLGEEDGP